MPENKIRVTAIQRLCVNDGPGVRTVVFLKGCYLHCPWCCNPEAIHYNGDVYFEGDKCKYPEKNKICQNCELFGGLKSREHCPIGAFEKTYKDYSVDELFELLMRDSSLYKRGGGVTFSGGEPLCQAEELEPLLSKLRREKIHVALETTLFAPTNQYHLIQDYVDYWLIDLKFQYGYIKNTDFCIDECHFKINLEDFQKKQNDHVYRIVVMKENLQNKELIIEKLLSCNIDTIELLPYHSLAENKYKKLKKTFHKFASPSVLEMENLQKALIEKGIICNMQKI